MSSPMPEGTHLAYTVYHEAEWWNQLRPDSRPSEGRPTVQIAASAHGAGGGVAWEFAVIQVDLGSRPSLKLSMFDDARQAFRHIPEFFVALAERGESMTLNDVRALLDSLGAVDETERTTDALPARP